MRRPPFRRPPRCGPHFPTRLVGAAGPAFDRALPAFPIEASREVGPSIEAAFGARRLVSGPGRPIGRVVFMRRWPPGREERPGRRAGSPAASEARTEAGGPSGRRVRLGLLHAPQGREVFTAMTVHPLRENGLTAEPVGSAAGFPAEVPLAREVRADAFADRAPALAGPPRYPSSGPGR